MDCARLSGCWGDGTATATRSSTAAFHFNSLVYWFLLNGLSCANMCASDRACYSHCYAAIYQWAYPDAISHWCQFIAPNAQGCGLEANVTRSLAVAMHQR